MIQIYYNKLGEIQQSNNKSQCIPLTSHNEQPPSLHSVWGIQGKPVFLSEVRKEVVYFSAICIIHVGL